MGAEDVVVEYSAGGIVFFGDQVLVLENQRGDHVFPKGHLEKGETTEEAALREVCEEAGICPKILGPLGTTRYRFFASGDRKWRLKIVNWFLMEATDDTVRSDGREILSGRYLPVPEAGRLLTYDLDREKLKQAEQDLTKYRQV